MNIKQELRLLKRNLQGFLSIFFSAVLIYITASVLLLQFLVTDQYLSFAKDVYQSVAVLSFANDIVPAYGSISSETIEKIDQSKNISASQTAFANGGLLDEGIISPFYSHWYLQNTVIFRGILETVALQDSSTFPYSIYNLRFKSTEIYTRFDPYYADGDSIIVSLDTDDIGKYRFEPGKEYLICAQYFSGAMSVLSERVRVIDTAFSEMVPVYPNTDVSHTKIIAFDAIPDIDAYFAENDYQQYIQAIPNVSRMVTLRTVNDMNDLYHVNNASMQIIAGRFLHRYDADRFVCVISDQLASANDWQVGDMVSLHASEECFNIYGYHSGNPGPKDFSKLNYRIPQTYEIVGIYTYDVNTPNSDFRKYDSNDIFIPSGILSKSYPEVTCFEYSFTIPGDRIHSFEAETLPELENAGYSVQMTESHWDNNKDVFERMRNINSYIRVFMIPILLIETVVLVFLAIKNNLSEYAIRKLLGSSESESVKAIMIPFLTALLSACLISICLIPLLFILIFNRNAAVLNGFQLDKRTIQNGVIAALCLITAVMVIIIHIVCLVVSKKKVSQLLKL